MIRFIAETPQQLQEMVNKVNEEGKMYGMKINAEKKPKLGWYQT